MADNDFRRGVFFMLLKMMVTLIDIMNRIMVIWFLQINDSWKRIADTMGVPVHELKKKKESLMTYFRNNLKNKLLSLKSGAGEEDTYKPIWLFYDAMEVFLKDVYECKSICNSEENTPQKEEDTVIDELDGGERSSTTGMQTGDAGNSTLPASLENSNRVTNSKVVQKRRAKNPPELQEASKYMSAAFNTLNNVLQTKKNREDKEEDDSDLFCKLLAKQLKDFPKDEREEVMYEIHGLILNKSSRRRNRVLQSSPSHTFFRSSSARSSSYSNESLPRNTISPDSLIDQQPTLYSHTCPSQIISNRPSSSHSSYITPTLPQSFNQQKSHGTLFILSQDILQTGTNNILVEAFEKATTEQ